MHISKAHFRQFTSGIVVALPSMGFGTTLSWISINQKTLESHESPVGQLSREQISWIGSLPAFGAILGALFWGSVINRVGRKRAAILANIPFIISYSVFLLYKNFYMILVLRILCGIGVVANMLNTISYLAELTEDSIRSNVCSMLIIFVNVGSTFTFVIGAYFTYDQINFINLILPVTFVILIAVYPPESPTDLLKAGKEDKAKEKLKWLRATTNEEYLQSAISKLKESFLNFEENTKKISFSDIVHSTYLRKSLIYGIILQSSIVMSGISTMSTYSNSTLQLALHNPHTEFLSIFLTFPQFIGGFICLLTFSKFNRKVFLVGNSIICGTSFLTCAVLLLLESKGLIVLPWYLTFSLLFIYMIGQGLGYSSAVYTIVPELFAVECRNLFCSVLLFVHFALHFSINKLYPVFVYEIQLYGWFFLFASYNFFITFFGLFILPETKGRSIQEVVAKLCKEPVGVNKTVHISTISK